MSPIKLSSWAFRHRPSGFAYVEVLVSVVLLGVLLVPAMNALTTGIRGSSVQLAARHLNLRNKMEEVLSQPFSKIYAQTYLSGGNTTSSVSAAYSDAVGSPNRRVVVFYRYSVSTKNRTSGNSNLLYVSVYYESDGPNGALNSLAGKWW